MTTWLPVKYAVIGKYLKVVNNNQWSDGWRVCELYSKRPAKEVLEGMFDHKRSRKVSDI